MPDPLIVDVPLSKISSSIATGSMVTLRDGRIMWLWSTGIRLELLANYSSDGGQSWSDAAACKMVDGRDVPSAGNVSVIRMACGDLGLVQLTQLDGGGVAAIRKFSFYRSKDDGESWSEGVPMNGEGGRNIQLMDCLIQLSSGRLVVPFSVFMGPTPSVELPDQVLRSGKPFGVVWSYNMGFCFCYYSDDEGRTWHRSRNEVHATINRGLEGGYMMDEPMVAETADGRLLMLANTSLGRLFRSYSEDGGETWLEAEPTDLVQRRSPLNLKRIPGTPDLLVIWNQVSNWEQLCGLFRHRLSCAVSSDHGQTWKHHKNLESFDDVCKLEPEPLSYWVTGGAIPPLNRDRYHRAPGAMKKDHPSCLFHDGKAIIAYGVNNLGAQQVIENTYAMDYEEVARKNGFQRSAQHGNPGVSKAKWYEGFNRVQIAPLEWLYQEANQSLQVSDFSM